MKTLIGVNTLDQVNSFVYASHCAFFAKTKELYPNDEFIFFTPYRMAIDQMRNMAAKMALDSECDYLMFIDDDVAIQPHTYQHLREADKDLVMAITFVRGYPFPPMFFKASPIVDFGGVRRETLSFYDDWEDNVDSDGLVKCQAVGFSCVLIKTDLIKAIEPPYFVTGAKQTEDVYFCCKARNTLEPEPSIYVDTTCPTSHFMMPDAVTLENVKRLREFYSPNESIGKTRTERIFDTVKELELIK